MNNHRDRPDFELGPAHTPGQKVNRYPRTLLDGYGYHHNSADLMPFSWVEALITDYLEWLPREAP